MKVIRKHVMANKQTAHAAEVYHDLEWEEWRVKFYVQGIHLAAADYHTNDELDALDTAGAHCGIGTDKTMH